MRDEVVLVVETVCGNVRANGWDAITSLDSERFRRLYFKMMALEVESRASSPSAVERATGDTDSRSKGMATDLEAVAPEGDLWWSQAVATRTRSDTNGGKKNMFAVWCACVGGWERGEDGAEAIDQNEDTVHAKCFGDGPGLGKHPLAPVLRCPLECAHGRTALSRTKGVLGREWPVRGAVGCVWLCMGDPVLFCSVRPGRE